MITTMIDPVDEESTNLTLHVTLSGLRYAQLIHKFDEVDNRLRQIEENIIAIKETLQNMDNAIDKTYLKWGGFVIVTLVGVVISLALRLS